MEQDYYPFLNYVHPYQPLTPPVESTFCPSEQLPVVSTIQSLQQTPFKQENIEPYLLRFACKQEDLQQYIQGLPCKQENMDSFFRQTPCKQENIQQYLQDTPCKSQNIEPFLEQTPMKQEDIESYRYQPPPRKQQNIETDCLSVKKLRKSRKILHQNEDFSSQPQQKTKRNRKRKSRYNANAWKVQEDNKYIKFLKYNRNLFELPPTVRKNIRLNVLMSQKVGSRSAEQCHSHHQKLIVRYGSIDGILAHHHAAITAARQKRKLLKATQLPDMPLIKSQEKVCEYDAK